ncbi:MAG: T9SS type A sorting domain-containing protein [bacterium]|nr:T9SS type A sorting domain-containing protein [bacterium]
MCHLVSSALLFLVLNPAMTKLSHTVTAIKPAYLTNTLPIKVEDRNITATASYGTYNKFMAVSGDTFGCSQYDRQWNLSPVRFTVWDPRNNYTHTLWMKQLTTGGVERHMFYNCHDGSAWVWPGLDGGTPVQTTSRDGYGCMDLDTAGNAVVAMHRLIGGVNRSCVYGDALPGMGSFGVIKELPCVTGDSQTIWPVVAVDGAGDMIVVASTDSTLGQPAEMDKSYYSRCSAESIATGNWSAWAPFDTNTGISYTTFASKIPGSKKMCIAWNKDVLDESIYNGHMVCIESQDGGKTWGTKVDVMDLISRPAGHPSHYNDITNLKGSVGNTYGIYDSQENIHLVTDASLGTSSAGSYYPGLCCALWHYSSEYDSVSMISYHSYPYPTIFAWAPVGGAWSDVLYPYYGALQAKPVIGEDPITKTLYVMWIEFPIDTYSIAGYESGEIFASYSLDKGRTWAPKMNLTMTPADCEVFLTMAPIVNDTLHFSYELDISGYDDIAKTALDPNKNPFIRAKQPITRGDVEVVSINNPDTLTPGDIIIPSATYKNNGAAAVDFQARYEMNMVLLFDMGDSVAPESLITPALFYYDVKNITIPAGDTIQVAFKPYTVIGDTAAETNAWYEVYATMLIDTVLNNNYMDSAFVIRKAAVEEGNARPNVFTVSSAYPNPAKGIASIKYSLPKESNVAVKVYDVTGKLVNTLVNENRKAGTYITTWNGKNTKGNKVSTGLYFYRVEAGSKIETRKIVLVK